VQTFRKRIDARKTADPTAVFSEFLQTFAKVSWECESNAMSRSMQKKDVDRLAATERESLASSYLKQGDVLLSEEAAKKAALSVADQSEEAVLTGRLLAAVEELKGHERELSKTLPRFGIPDEVRATLSEGVFANRQIAADMARMQRELDLAHPMPEIRPLPPDPIHRTNARLENLVSSIETLRDIGKGQVEYLATVSSSTSKLVSHAVSSSRMASLGLLIAALALSATVAVSIWSVTESNESSAEIAELLRQIKADQSANRGPSATRTDHLHDAALDEAVTDDADEEEAREPNPHTDMDSIEVVEPAEQPDAFPPSMQSTSRL